MQKYTWFSYSIPHQNEAELTGFYFQSAGAISSKPLLELYRDRLQIICHFCWKPTTQEDQCCSIIKICGNTTDFYANIGTRCECSFSGWATHRFLKQLQFIKEKIDGMESTSVWKYRSKETLYVSDAWWARQEGWRCMNVRWGKK